MSWLHNQPHALNSALLDCSVLHLHHVSARVGFYQSFKYEATRVVAERFGIWLYTGCWARGLIVYRLLGTRCDCIQSVGREMWLHTGCWAQGVIVYRVLGAKCDCIQGFGSEVWLYTGCWTLGVIVCRVLGARCARLVGPCYLSQFEEKYAINTMSEYQPFASLRVL